MASRPQWIRIDMYLYSIDMYLYSIAMYLYSIAMYREGCIEIDGEIAHHMHAIERERYVSCTERERSVYVERKVCIHREKDVCT